MSSLPVRLPLVALTALALLLSGCVGLGGNPSLQAAPGGPGRLVELDMYVSEASPIRPYDGKTVTGFGFSLSAEGPFTTPGPEIRIREGDTLRVTLHSIGIGHTIHWHGIKLPWAMDGVPFMTQTIVPNNSTYVYEWTAVESGTYWYHCHVDAPSHIDFGLFGALIIEPRDPAQDPPFDREHTMLLSEVDSTAFAPFSAIFGHPEDLGNYPHNPFDAPEPVVAGARALYDVAGGFIVGGIAPDVGNATGGQAARDYYNAPSIRYRPVYDTFMINGKSFPETEPLLIKTGETVRIRVINAGQLTHSMHLHGTHFLVTHKDGYKLPAPYYADTVLVGPAERYDLYVEGDNPGIWDFHDHGGMMEVGGYASNDHAFPGGMSTMLVYEDFMAELPEPKPEPARTNRHYLRWLFDAKGLPIPLTLGGTAEPHHAPNAAPIPRPQVSPAQPPPSPSGLADPVLGLR